MLEITVNVTGLEGLVEALKGLAVRQGTAVMDVQAPQIQQPMTPAQAAMQNLTQPQPIQAPAPQQTAPPITVPVDQPVQQPMQQPVQAPPVGIPTTAVNYTLDQLAVAATQLNDMGKRDALVAMLNRFGIPNMTQLPKEMYGAFANELRVLGAKL